MYFLSVKRCRLGPGNQATGSVTFYFFFLFFIFFFYYEPLVKSQEALIKIYFVAFNFFFFWFEKYIQQIL